jgi:hypothetical protein
VSGFSRTRAPYVVVRLQPDSRAVRSVRLQPDSCAGITSPTHVTLGPIRPLELRLETFNLFNTFNWGDPGMDQAAGGTSANINSGQFGRITTQAGTPRIIQLGMKYTF